MKNVVFLLLAFVALNLHAGTPTGAGVDPSIEAKFQREFGLSLPVSWQIIEGCSVATFDDHGEVKQVYYYDDGEVFGRGRFITRSLLPDTVSKSIDERFGSGSIQSAYEFKSNDSPVCYYVYVITPRHAILVSANEYGVLGVRKKTKIKAQAHLISYSAKDRATIH